MKSKKIFLLGLGVALILLAAGLWARLSPVKVPLALPKTVNAPFRTQAVIRYRQVTSTVTVERENPGRYTLTWAEPPALNGLSVVLEQEEVTLEYMGLQVSVDPRNLSSSAAARLLVSALSSLSDQTGITLALRDNVLTAQGEMEAGSFIFTFDPKTGSMLTLSVPEQEFFMEFTQFHPTATT